MTEKLTAMPLDWDRALAIVAHPDDLEYGAAAAVAEWTDQGKHIGYLLVTRGEAGIDGLPPGECAAIREQEQRASAAVVGVETVEFLDHRDGVIEEGVALRRDLAAAVRRHRPDLLITINHRDTWGGRFWNTPDHRAVGRAVIDAAADAGNRWIFPEQLRDGSLEPWGGVRWVAVAASPEATHAQPVGDGSVERAIRSLTEHRAYLEGLGADPAEYARDLITRGAGGAAERFDGRRCVAFELFPR
ncbi:N-acetylglucosaminyl deacetylase, LmbE family [Streptomyces aidingensis]|uniref:N-acetylglucosaminyl deacetylase, LmbE family n=2 Tax=Streptomyces aidingensis TaxID=910347 RepID=A0A1I1M9Z9_9ACTN|nr:PIG-L deacetylase family protein [Streptomyces aidingensis]SFC82035.1 N-acetylglucosaminyl deacetylase, LmbE family [Streptomyces aidingensis]